MTFDELQRIADENPYIVKVRDHGRHITALLWDKFGDCSPYRLWTHDAFAQLNHCELYRQLFGRRITSRTYHQQAGPPIVREFLYDPKNHPKRKFFSMGFAPREIG